MLITQYINIVDIIRLLNNPIRPTVNNSLLSWLVPAALYKRNQINMPIVCCIIFV